MSRAQQTSTVEQNTGGAVAPFVAGKNKIINGNCAISQRGTTFATPSNSYTLDRWCATPSAGGTTWSVAQVASFLTGSQFAIRTQRASGQTGTPALFLGMAFESSDIIKLQGQTVTWSFYAKAGSDFSATSNALAAQFYTGTGTDQGPFVGHTGEVSQINTGLTLSKIVSNRYSYTFTVPTNATSARWNISFVPTGTAATNDYFDITNMQLEVGSVATPFTTASGTLQGELALCQRYYWRSNGGLYGRQGIGIASSTTSASILINLPITMRIIPTTIEFASLLLYDNVTATAVSAASLISSDQSLNAISVTCTVASGLTQYRPYVLANFNNASGYLGVLAEL
jgi:hypothetical protein